MNSTQLHYREATEHLKSAADNFLRDGDPGSALAAAQVHALLALTTAIVELTRHADPQTTVNVHLDAPDPAAVARAVGVLRPITNLHHHAHNAFGSDR